MSDRKKLTLRRKEIELDIEGLDGVERAYTLKELIGPERDKWMNAMSAKTKIGPDGKPSAVKDFRGVHASLIGISLYDQQGNLVGEKEVDSWPASIQDELFKMAQKLSGLDNKAEEDAKND